MQGEILGGGFLSGQVNSKRLVCLINFRAMKQDKAFKWIISILNKHRVPFVVTGGLAAKSYGSPRLLNDIDIDIPSKCFKVILNEVRPFVIYGPGRYKDERWDLLLMTLVYVGQEIDISGGETIKICDARTGEWKDSKTDFKDVEERKIFNLIVPVISKKSLVAYKSMLAGDHQRIDPHAVLRNTV